jgi:hypothetical protein
VEETPAPPAHYFFFEKGLPGIAKVLPLSSQSKRLRDDLHNDRGIAELGNSVTMEGMTLA